MRRILLLAVGVLTLALVVPAGASAHRGHGAHQATHGHKHHHKKKAKRAKKARHIGAQPGDSDAATIASYADGTLTLTLANGSTVSGAVTDETSIGCVPAAEPAPTASAAHRGGDDRGDDDHGDDDRGDDDHGDDDRGDDDGDRGDCGGGPDDCDASDLVPGAVVQEAILKLGGDGPEFKLVLLRKQAVA